LKKKLKKTTEKKKIKKRKREKMKTFKDIFPDKETFRKKMEAGMKLKEGSELIDENN